MKRQVENACSSSDSAEATDELGTGVKLVILMGVLLMVVKVVLASNGPLLRKLLLKTKLRWAKVLASNATIRKLLLKLEIF